jgi:hypothetical protein
MTITAPVGTKLSLFFNSSIDMVQDSPYISKVLMNTARLDSSDS